MDRDNSKNSIMDKTFVVVPTNMAVRRLTFSSNNSSLNVEQKLMAGARDVEKNHIKAIRDFTRAQLVFLEGKRTHISANSETSQKFSEKSKELMDLYQKDKVAISEELKSPDVSQDVLKKHILETKRIQDKTTRLQNKAKLLVEKRKSSATTSRAPSSFESSHKWYESLNNSAKKKYVRERRLLTERWNNDLKTDASPKPLKSPRDKDLTTVCTLQEKAVDSVNRGIMERMQKISHVPLDERRRIIARGFYENEYTWLEINKNDAFILNKFLVNC